MQYVKAKKSYGQNFLKNREILAKISSSVVVNENDLIIEVGCGMGALTEYLFGLNAFLVGYEIDERMQEYLGKYNTERSKIIFGDFLKRNIVEDIRDFKYDRLYVIANIPYYITSPIILKLLELDMIKEIVLLVQKEFAERIVSKHNSKAYNSFTLLVDYSYDSELLFLVNRSNFVPVPKVDSAVVKLVKKEEIVVKDKEFYFKFIKDAFRNKRKTLRNNLKDYDWENIREILEKKGYLENVRAEEISKEDFKYLVNEYLK